MQTQAQVAEALKQITRYTHNRQTSARLLYAVREDNRHQTLQWCVERTIAQLVRDRR
ncbi:hypothetical protein [Leptolyngbya sp. KIOST-1]|uniref:hypothetical protein n=1 Tax=Leptolyngbya sp. KIOST-1 TaxID=1229172 RepID=UPI000AA0C1BB|nr:hypothetical protein [Leptolyngbya sp. KIOST-1]